MNKRKNEVFDENGAIEKINDMSQSGFKRFMVIPSVKIKKDTKVHLTPEDSRFVNDFAPVAKDDAIARVRRLFEFGFENVNVLSFDFSNGNGDDQTTGYKVRTVGELLNFIQTNKAKFPLGADTPLVIADDEGNSMHKLFSVEQGRVDGRNSLVLSYDMYGE